MRSCGLQVAAALVLVLIAGEVHADFKLVRNSTVYVASGNQYLETMDSVHADNACASGVLCSWNNQTIESHDGCTPSSVTLAVGQGTSVVCRYHYHNNSSPTQSLSWSATISVSRPACTARTLTLSGGGTVRALNSLEPFSAAVSCNGVPEPNVRVVLSTEPRDLPLLPAAGLFKSQNEMASCVGALDCLTDADGRIAFGFSAPDTEGDYLVRAVCADFNKPCTPPSPVEVRVEQCAVTLTIAGPGEMEPSSYSAEFMVSAEDCDENEVAELEIEIAATVETGSGFHDHSDSSYERPVVISRSTQPVAMGLDLLPCNVRQTQMDEFCSDFFRRLRPGATRWMRSAQMRPLVAIPPPTRFTPE